MICPFARLGMQAPVRSAPPRVGAPCVPTVAPPRFVPGSGTLHASPTDPPACHASRQSPERGGASGRLAGYTSIVLPTSNTPGRHQISTPTRDPPVPALSPVAAFSLCACQVWGLGCSTGAAPRLPSVSNRDLGLGQYVVLFFRFRGDCASSGPLEVGIAPIGGPPWISATTAPINTPSQGHLGGGDSYLGVGI
jgi:hypothetical protein